VSVCPRRNILMEPCARRCELAYTSRYKYVTCTASTSANTSAAERGFWYRINPLSSSGFWRRLSLDPEPAQDRCAAEANRRQPVAITTDLGPSTSARVIINKPRASGLARSGGRSIGWIGVRA